MKTIKGIKNFLKNVWKFRHNLWDYKWWDYEFTLDLLYTSISIMEEEFRTKGIQEKVALSSQVIQMNRVKTILENIKQSNYLDMAKAELGMDFIDNCWQKSKKTVSISFFRLRLYVFSVSLNHGLVYVQSITDLLSFNGEGCFAEVDKYTMSPKVTIKII